MTALIRYRNELAIVESTPDATGWVNLRLARGYSCAPVAELEPVESDEAWSLIWGKDGK